MVVDEFLEEVVESLRQIRPFIPLETILLFDQLISPDEVPRLEECFLLISAHESAPGRRFAVVKEDLLIPAHMAQNEGERTNRVLGWLVQPVTSPVRSMCDFLTLATRKGTRVYLPNRFPKEYTYYGNEVSFLEVFST